MTTVQAAAARRVCYQLDTLWDFDYEPTHHELESLYETAMKKHVWTEMGFEGEQIWRDAIASSPTVKAFNRFLFTEVLIPRLDRLGLLSARVAPRYRRIGLLD
jgi:hypothetical protein